MELAQRLGKRAASRIREVAGSLIFDSVDIRTGPWLSPTRMLVSPGQCSAAISVTSPRDRFRRLDASHSAQDVRRSYLAIAIRWRGMVKRSLRCFPNLVCGPAWHRPIWAPLRWKHAKIHRGSRPELSGRIKKP